MTHIKDYIVIKKFGGGSLDWDFLEEKLNDFEISDDTVDSMIEDECSINSMIGDCFNDVIRRLEEEFEELESKEDWYSIYTNCIDSHLNIFDEEVYSYKGAKEQVEKHLITKKD